MLVELESRDTGAGKVYLCTDGVFESCAVAVHDQDNRPVAVIRDLTLEQARELFWHPFADARVCNLFNVQAQLLQ